MEMQQQSKERFLLFEDQIRQHFDQEPPLHSRNEHCFWSNRFVLKQDGSNDDDNKFWKFDAFDLLMGESRPVQFRKTENDDQLYYPKIYSLTNDFGLIVEVSYETKRVNFVELDWDKREFQLIDHFQVQATFLQIFVDKMQPSKFAMNWIQDGPIVNDQNRIVFNYRICKLVDGKIQRGNDFQSDIVCTIYSNDKLFGVKYWEQSEITINDLTLNQQQTLQIDESHLPQGAQLYGDPEWVNDRLFMSVEFQGTSNSYGIVWADMKTKRWTLIDFETDLPIKNLQFIGNNLIVDTKIENDITDHAVKIYSIPMMRPNPLRRSSWLLLLHIMKQKGEENPIEAASEYLPLNSDLRSPCFKDKEPTEESVKKLSI